LIFFYSIYFHFIKILSTVFFSSAILFVTFITFFLSKEKKEYLGYTIGRSWGKTILKITGIKIKTNINFSPEEGKNYIFAGNHQSSFDIYLLYSMIPIQFYWLAKKSLFKIPFLGWAMKFQGHIGVERENSSKAAESLKKAINRIKSGISIAIFPEGGRSQDGTLQPFKKGAFALARLSQTDIVPVLIKNACLIAPKGKFLIHRKHTVLLNFYPAISGKDKEAEKKLRFIFEEGLKN